MDGVSTNQSITGWVQAFGGGLPCPGVGVDVVSTDRLLAVSHLGFYGFVINFSLHLTVIPVGLLPVLLLASVFRTSDLLRPLPSAPHRYPGKNSLGHGNQIVAARVADNNTSCLFITFII